jgi:hypothetical protein
MMDVICVAPATVALWWFVVRASIELPQAMREEKRGETDGR